MVSDGLLVLVSGSSSTLHAGGAELLPGQVDGVVVLLGMALLPVQEIRPSANILQALLGVPHGDYLQGLRGDNSICVFVNWLDLLGCGTEGLPLMQTGR